MSNHSSASIPTQEQNPLFSVVMPTRNRGHLLRYAIQSVLAQDFDDFEMVISDNCSNDDTPAIVAEFDSAKIRYIRVEKPLSMPEHWELASKQAKGRYIAYLCDDDAWSPHILKRVAQLIEEKKQPEVVSVKSANYYGSNWFTNKLRNSLTIFDHSGKNVEYDSRESLKYLYGCRGTDMYEFPRMLNSFCRRDVFQQIQEKYSPIFRFCPDFSFTVFILAQSPTWHCIDEPLYLRGVCAESIGAVSWHTRGKAYQQFIDEFAVQSVSQLLERVPLQTPVVTNYIVETLLDVKESVHPVLADIEVDWLQYFVCCGYELWIQGNNGVNIQADEAELLQVLKRYPEEFQAEFKNQCPVTGRRFGTLRNNIRQTIDNSKMLLSIESFLRADKKLTEAQKKPTMIPGKKGGFSNIAECAMLLPDFVQKH